MYVVDGLILLERHMFFFWILFFLCELTAFNFEIFNSEGPVSRLSTALLALASSIFLNHFVIFKLLLNPTIRRKEFQYT